MSHESAALPFLNAVPTCRCGPYADDHSPSYVLASQKETLPDYSSQLFFVFPPSHESDTSER